MEVCYILVFEVEFCGSVSIG